MAIKTLAIPWLSGGALLLGYAAFAWLRSHQQPKPKHSEAVPPDHEDVEPLSQRLERVPEELVLDFDEEFESPPQSGISAPRSALGDLFLARAIEALTPREFAAGTQLGLFGRSSAQ